MTTNSLADQLRSKTLYFDFDNRGPAHGLTYMLRRAAREGADGWDIHDTSTTQYNNGDGTTVKVVLVRASAT